MVKEMLKFRLIYHAENVQKTIQKRFKSRI